MSNTIKYMIYLLLSLTVVSCSDSLVNKKVNKNQMSNSKTSIARTSLSPSQTKLKAKLKASAFLIRQIVSKPKARKELRYAINYYSKKEWNDERVYFSSMFNPKAAYKKQKANFVVNSFAHALSNIQTAEKVKRNTNYTVKELKTFFKKQDIALYFPYHKKWKNKKIVPTITYDPLDNEYVNVGWKPIIKNGKMQKNDVNNIKGWEKVTVNDKYAYNNPTMIIVPCEEGDSKCFPGGSGGGSGGGDGGGGSGGGSGGGNPSPPPPCVTGQPCAHFIQIGWAKLTHNFDGLFGGGSLIKWVMADAVVLQPGDEVTTHANIVAFHFSRGDVKHRRWEKLYTQIDDNWEDYELAKDFKIYEADGGSLTSIQFGVEVDFGPINGKFNITFKFGHKRDDIFRTFYHRNVFFADNNSSGGHGLKDGVRIRYADHLYWTMPITKIGLSN